MTGVIDLKQEIRILNASAELIQNYVNYGVCCFPKDREKVITTVRPNDKIAKKYFYILLLEMTLDVNPQMIKGRNQGDNLLVLLQKIAISPQLGMISDARSLLSAAERFISWLDYEFKSDIYSAISREQIKIKLTRKEAIYILGNWCKHSVVRLDRVQNKMVKIYKEGGVELNPGNNLLILGDIEDWLFDDFAGYHFTKLCELSSEVYHGIMNYIYPVKQKSVQYTEEFYRYDIPTSLTDENNKAEFYELLNQTRNIWMPKIITSKSLEQDNYL